MPVRLALGRCHALRCSRPAEAGRSCESVGLVSPVSCVFSKGSTVTSLQQIPIETMNNEVTTLEEFSG